MVNTEKLLYGIIPAEIEDKVYLLCKIKQTEEGYNVYLSNDFPVVWLNDKFKEKFGANTDLTIPKAQKDCSEFVLLSAGIFLWHKNKMILLKRDEKAPSYPGAIVEAAGRCGELPSLTMIKELNEEILITSLESNTSVVLALIDNISHREDVFRIKQKQTKDKAIDLEIKEIMLEEYYPKELIKSNINVFVNSELVESINGYSFYDEKDNTLEIRQSYKLGDEIKLDLIFDGEPFNRQIFLKDFKELKNEFASNTIINVSDPLPIAKARGFY